MNKIFEFALIGFKQPTIGLQRCIALLRGIYVVSFCFIFRRNVKIQLPFYVYQKVTITGPGKVRIGGSCSVYPNDFHGLSINTCTPQAEVKIGNHGSIGGLTINCHDRVTIGDRFISAKTLVQDSFFHYTDEVKSKLKNCGWCKAGPIVIGNNVWLGAQSYVLKGTKLGTDCVVSNGSVCFEKMINEFQLCACNPVKRTLSIEHLQKLRQ